jgi:hypothetical protein
MPPLVRWVILFHRPFFKVYVIEIARDTTAHVGTDFAGTTENTAEAKVWKHAHFCRGGRGFAGPFAYSYGVLRVLLFGGTHRKAGLV